MCANVLTINVNQSSNWVYFVGILVLNLFLCMNCLKNATCLSINAIRIYAIGVIFLTVYTVLSVLSHCKTVLYCLE